MRKLRHAAAQSGRTMTEIMESALREYLRTVDAPTEFRLEWTPTPARLRQGVDLSDRDSLYDLMEGLS